MTATGERSTEHASRVSISGGEAIARMIRAFGGGPVFGMGGFQLLPFYDACRRLDMPHHLVNDERSGVFAADAFAKTSGRVGLVDATLGPGATNLVTGLVEALNAGTPLVAIVGDTHRAHSWKNMTQESRQIDILRPAAKDILRIEAAERIPELLRRAFAVATAGRPGPVVVDVPEDVAHDLCEYDGGEFRADGRYQRAPAFRCRPDGVEVDRAAELLRRARRPVILAGGGVHLSRAAQVLTAFAEGLSIPVAHTLTGKGAVRCVGPVNAGLFGRYDRIANELIEEADVILVVGCKLGEIATKRYTIPKRDQTIIHLDILAEEFERTTRAEVVLWGDVRLGLEDLLAALADDVDALHGRFRPRLEGVSARMARWHEKVSDTLHSDALPVGMGRLLTEINRAIPADGYLVADGGFAAHWGGLLFDTRRAGRTFVPDRGFASIGYGLPGALGVALAAPGCAVLAVTGDGGFNMSLGELETARRIGATLTVVIVNNAASGYVKALQHLMYGPGSYHTSDLAETDYAAVATAFGCHGIRVERPDALAPALREALQTAGPSVVDVVVTRDPAEMLPGVDNRAVKVQKGDRVA